MVSDPAVCVECGAHVPSGRFSCPECGALRASVRGRVDHASSTAWAPSRSAPAEPASPEDPTPEASTLAEPTPELLAPEPAPAELASPGEAPLAATSVVDRAPSPPPGPVTGGYVFPSPAVSTVPEGVSVPAIFPPVSSSGSPQVFPPVAAAGSTVLSPTASAPMIAPTSVAAAPTAAAPTAAAPTTAPPVDPPVRSVRATSPLASLVGGVPLETPYDASGWLVRGGSVAATLSFVLPWAASSVGVVGSGAIGYGYFDRWALVNAWYLLPMLLAGTVLGLSVVPNRLLMWVRSGVLPLVAGALYLGIAFVYVGGPFGGGPGVAILAAASLALGAGGVLALRPGRHDEPAPTV